MLRVKRNTGIAGVVSNIKIYINDEEAATINQNKQIELELPNSEARMSVSQLGVHSNELVVKEGQVVEITARPWTYISFILLIIAISSLNVFLPATYRIVGPIILILLQVSIYFFVNGFEIKVVYP